MCTDERCSHPYTCDCKMCGGNDRETVTDHRGVTLTKCKKCNLWVEGDVEHHEAEICPLRHFS